MLVVGWMVHFILPFFFLRNIASLEYLGDDFEDTDQLPNMPSALFGET
jgi:hypothetical protein